MQKYFMLAGLVLLGACHKTSEKSPVTPVIDYIEFNKEIAFTQYFSFDLDSNGSKDFLFYTLLVGDPILGRDYHQYHIVSSIGASFPIDTLNEQTPALAGNMAISPHSPAGLSWYVATDSWIARKVIGTTGAPYWEGNWKDASHRYLAIRVDRAGHGYYGWLEVSFDATAEKIILHRAALCREAGKEVKAGV